MQPKPVPSPEDAEDRNNKKPIAILPRQTTGAPTRKEYYYYDKIF